MLKELLEDVSMMDFGKDIIPEAIKKYKVFSYAFQGYWEDVGTIKAYFDANITFKESKTSKRIDCFCTDNL